MKKISALAASALLAGTVGISTAPAASAATCGLGTTTTARVWTNSKCEGSYQLLNRYSGNLNSTLRNRVSSLEVGSRVSYARFYSGQNMTGCYIEVHGGTVLTALSGYSWSNCSGFANDNIESVKVVPA